MAVMPTDPSSPSYACDMAAYLREKYFVLVAGGAEKVVRYRGPNGEREVQFTQANISSLQAELQKWEGLCAGTGTTNPSRRFAIRAGSMRTREGT